MADNSGWFSLHRGWYENPIFTQKIFCQRMAWIWLIENACWEDKKVKIMGKFINLKRGQLSYSLRFLAKAWGWEYSKVRRFVNALETDTMIETENDNGQMLITICNYDKYQSVNKKTQQQTQQDLQQQRNSSATNINNLINKEVVEGDSEAVGIIKLFDDAIVKIWGESLGRAWPSANDKIDADEWLKLGITASYCRDYFLEQMVKMKSQNREPPKSLRFFSRTIRDNFFSGKKPFVPPQPVDEEAQWRMRMKGWKNKKIWISQWGEPPTSKKCQCPQDVLKEFGVAV